MRCARKKFVLIFGLVVNAGVCPAFSEDLGAATELSSIQFENGFATLSNFYKDDVVSSLFRASQIESAQFFKDLNQKRFANEHSPEWYVYYKKALESAQANDWETALTFLSRAGKPLSISESKHSNQPCMIDILFVSAALNRLCGHNEQSLKDLKSVFLLHQKSIQATSNESEIFGQ